MDVLKGEETVPMIRGRWEDNGHHTQLIQWQSRTLKWIKPSPNSNEKKKKKTRDKGKGPRLTERPLQAPDCCGPSFPLRVRSRSSSYPPA